MKKFPFIGLSPLVLLFSANAFAEADIHFTEYRILLTEKKTKVDYQVFNQGSSDAACSTNLIDYNVDPDGKLKVIKEGSGPQTSAKDSNLVRVSPKRFTIPANSNQKLKVIARQLRRQRNGEWVSYLGITCREATPQLQTGVNILPNFNYHIPIVVRKGNLNANLELTDVSLLVTTATPKVKINLKRTGARSIYGDFIVKELNSGKTLAKQVGISHYLQADVMPFELSLNSIPSGPVEVSFVENKNYGGELATSVTVNN